jgi:hypothetical protein
VGKKPPQSQKGGSHGLTPRMSAGLSPKEKKFKKFKKIGFPAGRRQPAELREVACDQQK